MIDHDSRYGMHEVNPSSSSKTWSGRCFFVLYNLSEYNRTPKAIRLLYIQAGFYFLSTSKMNSKTSNKELCLAYLRKYADKDLKAMEAMFDGAIVLRDWKIHVSGKEIALIETQKNFEAADFLEIEVLNSYENKDTIAAELKIILDRTEELYVVDVITFNPKGKITAIRAFKGRADS